MVGHGAENDAPWCPECGPTCPLHGTAENDVLAEAVALADRWAAVLDECKADPRWLLDPGVMALGTCLTELRRVLPPGGWDEEADAMFIDKAREATRDIPPGVNHD